MITLNDDAFRNILLQSDIKSMLLLSAANKHMLTLCDNHLWQQKYVIDMFPMKSNIVNWKREYKFIVLMRKFSRCSQGSLKTQCSQCKSKNVIITIKHAKRNDEPNTC